jgi:hypothetical protein
MTRRTGVLAAVVAAALFGACTQVSSDPKAVVALAFDSLPYPAVVTGDTLRNEAGVATALHASALNVDGNAIADAPVTFLLLDSGATVTSGKLLVSTNPAATTLRLIAQVGTLQSRTLSLFVTPRPDSVSRSGAVDTLRIVVPDGNANTSAGVTAHVWSRTVTPAVSATGWIVRYGVEYRGAPVSPASGFAYMVDDNGRRTAQDTTGTDGLASRRLRVVADSLHLATATSTDSLVVTATAIARGAPLAGSPVRVVIQVKAK